MGSGLPAYFSSAGLGSKVSTCDGPPFMNRWMTRLALPGKCGFFGASGRDGHARPERRRGRHRLRASSSAKPSEAKPMPARQSSSRRVTMGICQRLGEAMCWGHRSAFRQSTNANSLRQQQHLGILLPGAIERTAVLTVPRQSARMNASPGSISSASAGRPRQSDTSGRCGSAVGLRPRARRAERPRCGPARRQRGCSSGTAPAAAPWSHSAADVLASGLAKSKVRNSPAGSAGR